MSGQWLTPNIDQVPLPVPPDMYPTDDITGDGCSLAATTSFGVLVRGGPLPARADDYFETLIATGMLKKITG